MILESMFKASDYQVNWKLVNEHNFTKKYSAQVMHTDFGDKVMVTYMKGNQPMVAWFKIDKNQAYEVGEKINGQDLVVSEYQWIGDEDDAPENETMFRASWD